MMSIDDPVALAVMEWLSPQAGGRRSGPPSWPYAATCDFLEEDMRHHPGRSESPGYTMSIVLEPTELDFGYTFVAVDPDGHRLRVCATDTSGLS